MITEQPSGPTDAEEFEDLDDFEDLEDEGAAL